MGGRRLGAVLSAGVVAGLLAGFAAGVFHSLATEPVVQRAIDLEGALRSAAGEPKREELLSRRVQRVGVIVGFLLFGGAWGTLFGLAYWLLPGEAAGAHTRVQALGLALVGYWTLGVFPHFKYPANPPGVGNPETVGYRQGLYFTFLALSVIGALLGAVAYRHLGRLGRGWQRPRVRGSLVGALYAGYLGAMSVFLPNSPDAVRMAPELVAEFRWLSLVGVSIFWAVLAGAFALFAPRWIAPTGALQSSPHGSSGRRGGGSR